jgi:hypothetical protein
MLGLREFSERRRARVRVYVAEPALRQTMERLAPEHIVVHESRDTDDIHCTMVGATGMLSWD